MKPLEEVLQGCRRILISNPTGLGDVVHTLPVAVLLKERFPDAEIGFLASAHSEELLQLVPAISHTYAVPEYPRPKSRLELYSRRWRVARAIRREHYDAVINFRPVDKTVPMVLMSGARYRLGIHWMRHAKKALPGLYNAEVKRRWRNEASYQFMLASLGDAGLPNAGYTLGPHLVAVGDEPLPAELCAPYFHLSLFTSKESRQLRPEQTRQLIAALLQRYPRHQCVISCSAAQREVDAIMALIPANAGDRIRIFPGTLSTRQLAAVLSHAEAHLGPETGSLHLAWLVGARTVSWFLNHESLVAWVPYGAQHRVVVSIREQARLDGQAVSRPIQAISADHILDALADLLEHCPRDFDASAQSDRIDFRFVY